MERDEQKPRRLLGKDVDITRSISVRPMGVEVNAGRGGTATGSWSGSVSLPEGKEYAHRRMEIEVGPSLSDAFLHMAGPANRPTPIPIN